MADILNFPRSQPKVPDPKEAPELLKLPRVNPVGIVELPAGYRMSPRGFSLALRFVAASILVAFAVVGTVTTVVTLGAYCLTSHAGTPISVHVVAGNNTLHLQMQEGV